jgi:hypothetical protein
MLDFKEKRKLERVLFSRITIVILGVILAFLLSGVWGVYKKASIAYENKDRIARNLTDIQERKKSLLLDIGKLKSSRGVESEIRDKFGVVRDGEEVVVIVDPDPNKGQNGGQRAMSPRGLWQRFIGFFK